jgi:hypothetical protein
MFFVNSMADLFHSDVPDAYIEQVFFVMTRAHWHTFQILTKRVGRLRRLGQRLSWPANVWMGTSIENDKLTPRADALQTVPAAIRFLSCEPLLGPLPSLNLLPRRSSVCASQGGQCFFHGVGSLSLRYLLCIGKHDLGCHRLKETIIPQLAGEMKASQIAIAFGGLLECLG